MGWIDHLGKRTVVAAVPWRQLPHWLRVLRVIAIAGWAVSMALILTVGEMETAALQQPKIPDQSYMYPHDIKGTLRYFSERQERVYRVVRPMLFLWFGATFVIFCVYGETERRWAEKRRRIALEDLIRRIDRQRAESDLAS